MLFITGHFEEKNKKKRRKGGKKILKNVKLEQKRSGGLVNMSVPLYEEDQNKRMKD